MMLHRTTFRSLVLGGLAAATVLMATPPAAAQTGRRAMFTEAFRPDIMQRDIALLVTSLQLEEWQRPIMEALLEDYMTSFNTGVEAMKDKMKAAAEAVTQAGAANADQVLARTMEPLNAWRQEKERLSEKFMSDVKSQLGPQQLERWPAFERAVRRERLLPEGELSGESVDLFALVTRMQPTSTEDEAIRGTMSAYEMALDDALRSRLDRAKQLRPSMEQAMAAREVDRQADIQDQLMQASIAVREVNDRAIEAIAGAFGERGSAFRSMALGAGYPEVFRAHPVMLLMQQARKLDSLTDEQAQQIDVLMTEFAGVVDEADMRLLAVVRDDEPKAPRRRLKAAAERRAAGGAGTSGPRPEDPIATARAERDRAGDPFRERLMAILTPEQQEQLPGGPRATPKADGAETPVKTEPAPKLDPKRGGIQAARPDEQRPLRDRGGKGDRRKGDPSDEKTNVPGKQMPPMQSPAP